MHPINALTLATALLAGSLAPTLARAEDPALDKLRQRLEERLGDKAQPIAHPAPAPGSAGGKREVIEPKAGAKAKPGPKGMAKPHWGYAGEGAPEHWSELGEANRLCQIGTRQSPIDIRDGIKVDLEAIQFDYRPGSFSVIDNGHTIQVNLAPGNALTVTGRRYELVQFHFHRPSEERINGRQFEMVAHLVHKDAGGRLAVVAVMIERGPDDKPQPVVQQVWGNLPLEKGEAQAAQAPLDVTGLLPTERGYFTYMGSLTTPPCSEGVLWMVLRQPVQLTAQQIGVFAKLYPMNARPIQPAGGRLIKESQ